MVWASMLACQTYLVYNSCWGNHIPCLSQTETIVKHFTKDFIPKLCSEQIKISLELMGMNALHGI